MNKIDWTKWSSIAEILSAIAILVTLLYLGVQTRYVAEQTRLSALQIQQNNELLEQNTRTLQFEAYQSLIAQIGEQTMLNVENPEFARRFNQLAGMSAEDFGKEREEIDPVEYTAIANFLFFLTRHGDLAYYQYELGMLSRDRLVSTLSPISVRWCSALFRDWWTSRATIFAPSYRQYIETALGEC